MPGAQKYKYKGSPKPQSESAGGVDREELNAVVAKEMAQLKLFLKEVKGTRQNDPDNQLKSFYRDKYKMKYLGEDGTPAEVYQSSSVVTAAPSTAPAAASTAQTPKKAPSTPTRTKPQVSGTLSRREVDYAVANSDYVESQVGNAGTFKNTIPDGWDCGYTYRYAKDSVPPMARGVPMPATFGGGGGGGKCTQVLSAQAKGKEDHMWKITGREPPQHTKDWVTWASHSQGGHTQVAESFHSDAGKVQAVATHVHGGSGKRGRSAAIDEHMSARGGETNFSPLRSGQTGASMTGFFSPSSHNSNAHHDSGIVRFDAAGALHSDSGATSLGGGKRGRNPHIESRMSTQGGDAFMSAQAKPQMGSWGGATGGGSKGRCAKKDAAQSSNPGGLW